MKGFFQNLTLLLTSFALSSCLNGKLEWASFQNSNSAGGNTNTVVDTGDGDDDRDGEGDGQGDGDSTPNSGGFTGEDFGPDGKALFGFSSAGPTSVEYSERGRAVAIHPDGRIIIGMSQADPDGLNGLACAIMAVNTEGSMDSSFGGNNTGLVRINLNALGSTGCAVTALAIQGNKILFAGWTATSRGDHIPLLGRLHADGRLDTAFSTGLYGFTGYPLAYSADIKAMELDASGKIWLVASAASGVNTNKFTVLKFEAGGTPDNTYGEAGKLDVPLDGRFSVNAYAMAIHDPTLAQPRLYVSGDFSDNGGDPTAFVYGLDGDDAITSFAYASPQGGLSIYYAYCEIAAIAIQEGTPGNYFAVLTGRRTRNYSSGDAFLARIRLDAGNLDAGFGENNGATYIFPNSIDGGLNTVSVKTLPDGKLLTFAYKDDNSISVLNRFSASGIPDTTFGMNGFLELGSNEKGAGLAIGPGAYYLVGTTLDTPTDAYLRRYLP